MARQLGHASRKDFVELRWDRAITPGLGVSARGFHDVYHYHEFDPIADSTTYPGQSGYNFDLRTSDHDTGLETRLLRLERQGIELRRDDPRAAAENICLDAIADVPFLMHARDANPGHYDAVLEVFRERGVEPDVVHRTVTLGLRCAGEPM